jgi:hypothetical protein
MGGNMHRQFPVMIADGDTWRHLPCGIIAARLKQLRVNNGLRLERNNPPSVTERAQPLGILAFMGTDVKNQINAEIVKNPAKLRVWGSLHTIASRINSCMAQRLLDY